MSLQSHSSNMNTSVSCCQVNQRCSERERDEPEKPRALLPGEVPRSEVQHRDRSPQQLRVSRRDRSAAGQVACTLQNACMCDFPQVFCVHFFLTLKTVFLCFAERSRSSRFCVSAEAWSSRHLRVVSGTLSPSSIPPAPATL